ncbi:MAG: hypothetical protein LBD30_08585 [Verrucomicrobiales bacterium]|jgi:hypothetical protein|nr:hypothetical protein [Verrucomicrobiales bacterium]
MHADHDELDLLLRELSVDGAPPLTAGFERAVWREIRRRREGAESLSFWHAADWLLGAVWRPRPVFAALALALTVGVAVGSGAFAKPSHRVRLDAFFIHASDLSISINGR